MRIAGVLLVLLPLLPGDGAVLAGLKWLARHQSEDGSWGDPVEGCACYATPRMPAAPKGPSVDGAFVAKLVASLGSDDPEERDRATMALKVIGPGAAPALEKAAASGDFEISSRAAALLVRARLQDPKARVSGTSLALLAFLGAGYSHLSKETQDGLCFGTCVKRALLWLIKHQDADGFIGAGTEHALAALALSEAYGLTASQILKEPAQRAVNALVSQQRAQGWSADGLGDADTVSTTWAVMALKSAEISGLEFPRTAYDNALAWYNAVTDENHRAGMQKKGDFDGTRRDVATPCAMLARIFIEHNKQDPHLAAGAEITAKDLPTDKDLDVLHLYFASLSMFQFDGSGGPKWKAWNEAQKKAGLPAQLAGTGCDRGSWAPGTTMRGWSRVHATALMTMSFEIYYAYDTTSPKK